MAQPQMKRLADLCFNCKQCQLECPSNVNIPQLMIEAKAAYVDANGIDRTNWILSRAHFIRYARLHDVTSCELGHQQLGGALGLERLVGIHSTTKIADVRPTDATAFYRTADAQ